MARAKKAEEKAKETEAATIQISVDDFVRTRDAVVTGLSTLQAAVQDLSRAYIIHTNTVLGRAPGTSLDLLSFVKPLGENGLPALRATSPGTKSNTGVEEKKKRKREHDPNAPKRPLTPYFLYMQSARPIIASDLGEGAKPGAVSAEGTRRWTEMPDVEKQMWKKAYAENLAKYQEKVAEYKASNGGHAVEDAVAAQLAAENGTLDDIDEEHDVEGVESPDEVEVEPPPKSKRTKTSENAPKPTAPVKQTPVMPPGAKEVMIPPSTIVTRDDQKSKSKEGSPRKEKRKSSRKSKGAELSLPIDEVPEADEVLVEKKKENKRAGRKKRRSEVAE
ncbi:hypothetical protein FGG08_003437 [Glutinoglossum americanum]|uniref:HMG box domain-containing protein n=1 Tax=Glutinoglossum americanum TaxID=1670608 RepID=A0A9P8I2P1_9PEZI|nr:hypothetical protein FGG08_003437 [Glutinoglossum americanum]